MQVTLTPKAEQFLRQALAEERGQSAEEIVEQALASHTSNLPVSSSPDPIWEILKAIPGVKLPENLPPRFATFEPVELEGEPVSEQLIGERR